MDALLQTGQQGGLGHRPSACGEANQATSGGLDPTQPLRKQVPAATRTVTSLVGAAERWDWDLERGIT